MLKALGHRSTWVEYSKGARVLAFSIIVDKLVDLRILVVRPAVVPALIEEYAT